MWMVEWPNIVLWAGWDKCLHLDGILRGTLIIQFASVVRLCSIPGFKGKVGLKVAVSGFQVQDMLQDLARGALWVRVQDKTS